jgi:hypothetical protein
MSITAKNTKDLKHFFGRFFFYGDSGVGKTRLAGTFPKPIFLNCDTEGGILSLRDMNVDYHSVQDPEDVMNALEDLATDSDKGKLKYKTVVIDSLTVIQDNQLDILQGRRREAQEKKNRKTGDSDWKVDFYDNVNLTEAEWNLISTSLRSMFILAHSLPMHVIWIALAEREMQRINRGEDPILIQGYPMIYTKKAARKMPAICDFVWYLDSIRSNTTNYNKMVARSRGKIPPMIKGSSITYKNVAKALGLSTKKKTK